MLLAIDIGNTNIKTALIRNGQISNFIVHQDADQIIDYVNNLEIEKAAICSVNPLKQKAISEKLESKSVSVFNANVGYNFNLKIVYESPETLGMDRVCSSVGSLFLADKQKLLKKNQYLITIDFGTATTINIVSPEKEFLGGLIAPGINTMFRSLNEGTAQLPLTNKDSYQGLIGKTTNASIVSGVINSTLGMINEAVNKLEENSETTPLIFVTGGNVNFILPHLKKKVIVDEALVIKGLKTIYDLNK